MIYVISVLGVLAIMYLATLCSILSKIERHLNPYPTHMLTQEDEQMLRGER